LDVWLEVWKAFGWAGVAALLYARGWIATGREVKHLETELAQERQERITEKAELRAEIQYWRNLTWSFSKIADQVAGALPPRDQT
jgi:hypothetical protein